MIYIIQEKNTNKFKIGFTKAGPRKRLKALQTGNSSELILVATMDGDKDKEAEIHKEYAKYRARDSGEWFELWPSQVRSLVYHERGTLHESIVETRTRYWPYGLPNTTTSGEVSKELFWSESKLKSFVRKNDIPYYAQYGEYIMDENVIELIKEKLMEKKK